MMSGDQFKGYLDHGKDSSLPGPDFALLYVVVGLVALAVAVVAVFGWTLPALVTFATGTAVGVIGIHRLRSR